MGRDGLYLTHRGERVSPGARLSHWRIRIEDLPPGLFDRLRRGEPSARAQFFRRYAAPVRQILFLQDMCEDVDEAVQEVFIKVMRTKLPPQERFLGWFYTVILNTGRDLGRRRKTRQAGLERLMHEAARDTRLDSDQDRADPTGDVERNARDPALVGALRKLPYEFREAVALRFYADLSLNEIARCQSVPVGTVKSRLHGALMRLRSALQREELDEERGREGLAEDNL